MLLCSEKKSHLYAQIGSMGWRDFSSMRRVFVSMHTYVCMHVCVSMHVWTAWHRAESSEVPWEKQSLFLITHGTDVWCDSSSKIPHVLERGSVKSVMQEIMASLLSCYCYIYMPKFTSTTCSAHLVVSTWSHKKCSSRDIIHLDGPNHICFVVA